MTEDHVKRLTDLGVDEVRARFIVAIEERELDGDVEGLDGPLTRAEKRKAGLGVPIGQRHPLEDDE